jgi:L-ascorbate metabolism protein UlaG (beta-lactamase superfamily)
MMLSYGGSVILTDPMLSDKGAMEPFAGKERNPTVDLPLSAEELEADFVLTTHAHPDHFDPAAAVLLKDLPVLAPAHDRKAFEDMGLENLTPVGERTDYRGISIMRVGGRHGSGPILEHMGEVSGYILEAEGEPTVYWVGDSIWCDAVAEAIERQRPDIIITHSGGALIPGFDDRILMDEAGTLKAAEAAPSARIVAIHMEALDHCSVTRKGLREAAEAVGIHRDRLIIPADGDILEL